MSQELKITTTIDASNAKNLYDNEKWLSFITNIVETEGYTVKLIK